MQLLDGVGCLDDIKAKQNKKGSTINYNPLGFSALSMMIVITK